MVFTPAFLQHLGLDASADARAIRKAYAQRLKAIDQAADPEAFQALRAAYEAALRWVEQKPTPPQATVFLTTGTPVEAPVAFSFRAASAPGPEPRSGTESRPEADPEPRIDAEPESDPNRLALAVFEPFRATVKEWVEDHSILLDVRGRNLLKECLQDPRLLSLEARWRFEEQVASLLAGPPLPAQRTLLKSAAHVFGWHKDRRRLEPFGPAGQRLNEAIDGGALETFVPPGQRKGGAARPARASGPKGLGWLVILLLVVLGNAARFANQPSAPADSGSSRPRVEPNPLPAPRPKPPTAGPDGALPPVTVIRPLYASPLAFQEGLASMRQKKFPEAVARFSQAIQENPASAQAYFYRGCCRQSLNQNDKAMADYDACLRLNPRDAAALNNRSNLWVAKGEPERALGDLNAAIQADPRQALAYLNRGRIRRAQGDRARAAEDFRQAERLDPKLKSQIPDLGLERRRPVFGQPAPAAPNLPSLPNPFQNLGPKDSAPSLPRTPDAGAQTAQ